MTRDDKRELLHDFVDWHPGLDNYDCDLADAFLAQHAADLTPAPAEVATSSRSGGEGQGPPTDLLIDIPAPSASGARETHEPANGGRIEVGSESITEQWREWYRQSGGEYWDKVVDIERELGRGPDAPAAPWRPPSAMTFADIVAALALIHHDGSDAPATRLGFYGAEPVEPDLCALLKRLEWVVDYERVEPCPLCHETITTPRGELPAESKGHAPDCELAAVLAEQTAPHHSRVLAGGEAVTEYRTTEPDGTRHTLCLIDVPPPSLNQRVTVIIHGDSPTTVEFVAVGVTTKRRIAYGVEYQGQDSVVELRQVKREALP